MSGLAKHKPSSEGEGEIAAQFPGMFTGDGERWHYLDSGATAQKPRVVIDAMARALGEDALQRWLKRSPSDITRVPLSKSPSPVPCCWRQIFSLSGVS